MAHLSGLQIHLVFDFILISIIAYYFLNGAVVIEPNVYSSESYFEGCDDVQCDVSNNKEVIDTDVHVPQTPNGIQKEYEFALIADLDIHSRDSDEFRWYSYLTRGTLTRLPNGNFTISIGDTIRISSKTATNNRSMEMSELIMWQGNLIGFCDYTGMVYRIAPDGQVFQRYTIADGNGKESKPFKTEWSTKKDGNLYIGSIGKEWVTDNKILHTNAEWIKAMDSCGTIENIDWGQNYRFLREKTNTSYPGYLIHEAVTWHPNLRKWVFLPRRASSNLPYDPQSEERQGTNMLLLVDEEFKNIEIKSVGDLEPLWGFSSVKVVPETNELLVVKVFEVEGKIATKMTVFDVDGNIKLEPSSYFVVSDSVKYEGVEFV